jgi:hypothetical protein
MEDAIILIGMAATLLLWGFAAFGGLASLWDTFGDHLERLYMRLKR